MCAHVCSLYVYLLYVCVACLPMERAAITRVPSVYLHAVGLEMVFMSPSFLLSHLPYHPFPLHFLLLFKQQVLPNCHHGSQITPLLRIGWGGGAYYVIGLIPLMEADLELRAKARSLLLPLARPRTAPRTLLPWAEPDRKERESPTAVSQRRPNLKAAPIPLVWPGRGTKAVAPLYPQGSIHQTNCRGLIVNQQ